MIETIITIAKFILAVYLVGVVVSAIFLQILNHYHPTIGKRKPPLKHYILFGALGWPLVLVLVWIATEFKNAAKEVSEYD